MWYLNLQVKIELHFLALICAGLKLALREGKTLKQVQGDKILAKQGASFDASAITHVGYRQPTRRHPELVSGSVPLGDYSLDVGFS